MAASKRWMRSMTASSLALINSCCKVRRRSEAEDATETALLRADGADEEEVDEMYWIV
jgi:hypothetical protein